MREGEGATKHKGIAKLSGSLNNQPLFIRPPVYLGLAGVEREPSNEGKSEGATRGFKRLHTYVFWIANTYLTSPDDGRARTR